MNMSSRSDLWISPILSPLDIPNTVFVQEGKAMSGVIGERR